ncbi:MAG TPA: hypothetical protein VII46_02305 [Acidimicrobiales bacterium]
MTMTEGGPTRGRPPTPSLSSEAVAILERNAFSALRGPNSRGAVPRSAFEGIDVSTVDRSLKREFGGERGRTPFDLASRRVSTVEGGTTSTLQSVFEFVAQSFRDTDSIDETLRVFLRANFETACEEEGLLASFIVQAAACAHLQSGNEDGPDQSRAAREVIALRQELYAELTIAFAAGLAIALRRLRRRPRASHSLSEIVLAVGATSDGFLFQHKLQPELFGVDLVVDTQWNVIWSMTEPGLLDPPSRSNPSERRLVEAGLAHFVEGRVPSLEPLARECRVPLDEVLELIPTDEALAQRCMDYAVGNSVETEAIAVNVKGAELAAVRDLLIATTHQAEATPLLIEVILRDKDTGFCGEARRHIAEALGQSGAVNLDRSTADGVALMLLDAALQGEAGKPVWQNGLDAFASDQ